MLKIARCTVDWRSIRDLNSGGATNALSHFECDPFDLLGNAPYSNPPKSSPEKGEKSRREQQIFNCGEWCVFDDSTSILIVRPPLPALKSTLIRLYWRAFSLHHFAGSVGFCAVFFFENTKI